MANQSTLAMLPTPTTVLIPMPDPQLATVWPTRRTSNVRHCSFVRSPLLIVMVASARKNDTNPSTKKSARMRIDSDNEDEGESFILYSILRSKLLADINDHPGREEQDNRSDEEEDEVSPVCGRTRRVSEKQAQRDEEKTQAEARKQEKLVKAAKAAAKKAGEIEEDTRGPINDNFFTSRTVPSTRPMATKNLAQRNSKVSPAPKFPSNDWRPSSSTAHRRDRDSHSDDEDSYPRSRRAPSPHQTRQTFRGRSPTPQRVPVCKPIRNINGGVVPDSVTLNHVDADGSRTHQCNTRRHRSPSPPRSPPRPRSVSPNTGDKRRRSSSADSEDLQLAQSQCTTSSSGRLRAKDLDDTTKEYTVFAIDLFRCFISIEDACPDSATENAFVRRAWNGACEEMGEHLTLTPTVAKLITSRGSQLRGELKTKIRPLIDVMYSFKSGQNKKTIAFNRKLAEDLKEGSVFAFKDIEAKKGLYKHPILQSAVNAMWFANRHNEGPRHPEFFSPCVPEASLPSSLRIDERLTGIKTDVPFTVNDYRSIYEGHVKALEEFAVHTAKYQLLDKILKRMHTVGRFHSGAQPLNTPSTSAFSKQILDAALKEYEEGSTTDDASDAEE
ncbi:hypothetical protein B0H13DRAFT_2286426 [Mycena leptocephala]|nr:hypothetical protein B0H13DRAFT_2286426 [Mycena leptocephala]